MPRPRFDQQKQLWPGSFATVRHRHCSLNEAAFRERSIELDLCLAAAGSHPRPASKQSGPWLQALLHSLPAGLYAYVAAAASKAFNQQDHAATCRTVGGAYWLNEFAELAQLLADSDQLLASPQQPERLEEASLGSCYLGI